MIMIFFIMKKVILAAKIILFFVSQTSFSIFMKRLAIGLTTPSPQSHK